MINVGVGLGENRRVTRGHPESNGSGWLMYFNGVNKSGVHEIVTDAGERQDEIVKV